MELVFSEAGGNNTLISSNTLWGKNRFLYFEVMEKSWPVDRQKRFVSAAESGSKSEMQLIALNAQSGGALCADRAGAMCP